jgi:hypothetical protein
LGVELQGVGSMQECFGDDQAVHPSIILLFTTAQLQISIRAKPTIKGSNNQLFLIKPRSFMHSKNSISTILDSNYSPKQKPISN